MINPAVVQILVAALSLVWTGVCLFAALDWLRAHDQGKEWEPPLWLLIVSLLFGAAGALLLTYF